MKNSIKSPKSNDSDRNNAEDYRRAWQFLFDKQTPEMQTKVLQAAKSDGEPPYSVRVFTKRVIALAET